MFSEDVKRNHWYEMGSSGWISMNHMGVSQFKSEFTDNPNILRNDFFARAKHRLSHMW